MIQQIHGRYYLLQWTVHGRTFTVFKCILGQLIDKCSQSHIQFCIAKTSNVMFFNHLSEDLKLKGNKWAIKTGFPAYEVKLQFHSK